MKVTGLDGRKVVFFRNCTSAIAIRGVSCIIRPEIVPSNRNIQQTINDAIAHPNNILIWSHSDTSSVLVGAVVFKFA
jgi:hypothetical protein